MSELSLLSAVMRKSHFRTAKTLIPGSYDGEIIFINAMNGQGTQARKARLDVPARK